MPDNKKRSQRRRRNRTRRGKAKSGYKTLVAVNKTLNPIAQRYICKMKYAEVISSMIGGGTYGVIRLNLNSIFDPNRSGVGHQPYGHDTLQTMYNRYRVIGCAYRVSAVTSGNDYIQTAVVPANEVISVASVSEAREKPRAKYILQAPNAPLKIVSGYVSCPSVTGRTKTQYMSDDRYQAVFGADPSELIVLNVFSSLLTEGISTSTVYYNVELEYTVECFDVNSLGQS